jgi:hydroxymethylpyrimidine pyrophosphatase-like HAD family hydrolase
MNQYPKDILALFEAKRNAGASFSSESADMLAYQYLRARDAFYHGLVADHDGTLVPINKRNSLFSNTLTRLLNEMLDAGMYLIVITGRGDSIWQSLDNLDEKHHRKVFHAMYNGGIIVNYARKEKPISQTTIPHEDEIVQLLRNDPVLRSNKVEVTPKQVMIRVKCSENADIISKHVTKLIAKYPVTASSSGWAVDINSRKVNKSFALTEILKHTPSLRNKRLVKVGDKGDKIGNDYALLKRRYSFSVGDISPAIDSCFPVLDENGRSFNGIQGTLMLLKRILRNRGHGISQ